MSSSKFFIIRSENDIRACPQFGIDAKSSSKTMYALIDGVKKPLRLVLGSIQENLGLVVERAPDEVKVPVSGRKWEKEKLLLRLQRDADIKVIHCLNTIAKALYERVYGDAADWYAATDSAGTLKVKVHPIETLYRDGDALKYLGTGELRTGTHCGKKRKRNAATTPPQRNHKRHKVGEGVNTSDLLGGSSHIAVNTQELLLQAGGGVRTQHYKIYADDEVCVQIDVGAYWNMRIQGRESFGITLKATYLSFVARGTQEEILQEDSESEEEEEVPDDGMFT